VKEKNNYYVSACFFENSLLNLKIVLKAASDFFFLLSFAVIGQFSPLRNNFLNHMRLLEQLLESQSRQPESRNKLPEESY
jgi:hypothetical protein